MGTDFWGMGCFVNHSNGMAGLKLAWLNTVVTNYAWEGDIHQIEESLVEAGRPTFFPRKYPDALEMRGKVEEMGGTTLLNVDATKLHKVMLS